MSLILIVDDEPDMRLALSTVLKREGHSILEAGDAEGALEELTRRPIELVLLDIRLPGMDGVQMLKVVRQNRADLPVVMVTGYGSVDTAVQVMKLGADGYLSKPFSNRQLVETVERVLEARRLGQEAGPLHRRLAEKLVPPRGAALPGGRPVRSRIPWGRWAALAVALLGGLGALWGARTLVAPKPVAVPVPFSNPTALTWEQGQLWGADWVAQAAFVLRPEGDSLVEVRRVAIPGSQITGLAVVRGSVYTCDPVRRAIQKRKMDEALTLVSEVKSPGLSPSGLYFDGRYLWSCDSAGGRIYQHEPDDALTVVASYPSPGKAPVGLYKDEEFLWSADAETRRFYQHRLDDKLSVMGEFELVDLNAGSEPLSAISFHDGRWWVGRDGRDRLIRFSRKSLRRLR